MGIGDGNFVGTWALGLEVVRSDVRDDDRGAIM